MVNDTIADSIARIKNAVERNRKTVTLKHSRLVENIVSILKDNGFIEDFNLASEEGVDKKANDAGFGKTIVLHLNYIEGEGKKKINKLTRVSKPGLRIYRGYKQLRPVLNNYGISILSTPKGVLTNIDARKQKVGGEVLCEIY
jgi:small subunit ribosomal protein S8